MKTRTQAFIPEVYLKVNLNELEKSLENGGQQKVIKKVTRSCFNIERFSFFVLSISNTDDDNRKKIEVRGMFKNERGLTSYWGYYYIGMQMLMLVKEKATT